MYSKRFFGLTIALALATFVASAFAQQPNATPKGTESSYSQDLRSAHQNSPWAGRSPGDPALQKLWDEDEKLAGEARRLTRQLEAADTDAKRDEAKAKLREVLVKQFDARQKRHGLEIEALEAKVKKLKDIVRKRQDGREDIITRRLDQIVRDSQGLGW